MASAIREKGDQSSLLIKSLLSGGLAGMAGKSFVAPLDRVKILMQTQNIHYKGSGVWTCLGTFYPVRLFRLIISMEVQF